MSGTIRLALRIGRGGVYDGIEGDDPVAVLRSLSETVDLPPGLDRESLLVALLDREALMSTALGDGIAVPHPREPLVREEVDERVAVCFPRRPVPYAALDRKPVFALFLILSADTRSHLYTLSELSFLCRRPDFRDFLAGRPSLPDLTGWIRRAESSWKR
mgnify:CR=1 FL=1